ncbi:hypothetical protein AGMMS50268_24780 [Spirochaetia bacterium]|nr:hypothetical protein AGMMS50268_24780 [Spirochaetia bacterium]
MTKQLRLLLLFLFLLLVAWGEAGTEEWYLSNAAGMALEAKASRFAALRNKYSLSVGRASAAEPPDLLRKYYKPSWIIEVHTLFENGKESRRQWIFRDEKGVARLVAVIDPPSKEDDPELAENGEPSPGDKTAQSAPSGKAPIGFIELYDEKSLITAEHQFFEEGDELIIDYSYNKGILIRAETWLRTKSPAELPAEGDPPAEGGPLAENGLSTEPPSEAGLPQEAGFPLETGLPEEVLDEGPAPVPEAEEALRHINTDYYRYSRAASLRAVERVYHERLAEDEGRLVRLKFPHRILDLTGQENFVNPAVAYGSNFLEDLFIKGSYKVIYTTNERGRILSETHEDDGGNLIGELVNVWAGDRLSSVTWKTKEEERRIEYDYNREGDRIEERNYLKGILERVVRRENEREVEELYMNGVVILRAIWEDGRKISEERIRFSSLPGKSDLVSQGARNEKR